MAHFYGAEYKFQSKNNYSTESFHTVRIQPKILLFFFTFYQLSNFPAILKGKMCIEFEKWTFSVYHII